MAMGKERLSWTEIKQKYPHQNVGLVEIEPYKNSAGVKSAIVAYTDKTNTYEELVDMAVNGKIFLMYTTMDEDDLVGILGENIDERIFN